MQEKYLPIGSIVKLKDNEANLMITGYYAREYVDSVVIYDYEGIVYPEGTLLKNNKYAFNHEDIKEVIFKGYEDSKYTELNNKLLGKKETSVEVLDKEVPLVDIKYDTLEDNKNPFYLDSEPLQDLTKEINSILNEEPVSGPKEEVVNILSEETLSPEKKEEIVIPHYTFDENGIIIG